MSLLGGHLLAQSTWRFVSSTRKELRADAGINLNKWMTFHGYDSTLSLTALAETWVPLPLSTNRSLCAISPLDYPPELDWFALDMSK